MNSSQAPSRSGFSARTWVACHSRRGATPSSRATSVASSTSKPGVAGSLLEYGRFEGSAQILR